ncbi:hypothetical protein ACF0H5_003133 [Mactra antiquata]
MRVILLFFVVFSSAYCEEESISDLYELLKDPKILSAIEKRLQSGKFDVEDDLFSDVAECYDTSGTVQSKSECSFFANGSSIIKTSESIANGAEFLKEVVNITCPRDCTALCCDTPGCDTAVYQDKDPHKCYLFHCGAISNCAFTQHNDYWVGSVSPSTHKSHSFTPGGATHSHENDLENLGSNDVVPSTSPTPPPRTTVPTTTEPTTSITSLPGLGKSCPSYGSNCEDPHAECLMKVCRCRVGYHERNGICRKHCRNDEYECENYAYFSSARECVPNDAICDGVDDCIDGSDENKCLDKNKQELFPYGFIPYRYNKEPPRKPVLDNNGNRNKPIGQQHPDAPMRLPFRPKTTVQQLEPSSGPTTAAPVPTVSSTQIVKVTDLNPDKPVSQASADTDQDSEPVSTNEDKENDNQSTDSSESKNSNNTEPSSGEAVSSGHKFNILNADSMEVEVASYSDSFQGPIVALALGLAITLMLLIVVGCRLRTVKRRLRKGRALHSNEADYLINGMYL